METQCLPCSSSSSSSPQWKHDVFLSFRGEDTRMSFTDHLYDGLVRNGIITFKDDRELEIGDSVPLELMKAIEESKCAIIVFSRNYAASTWCLEELVKILECKNDMVRKLLVLPIFYNVNPSVVRHQKDTFRKVFAKHEERFSENMEKVKRWRKALTELANISGEVLLNDRPETDAIKNIRRKIFEELLDKCPSVTKGLVGINSQVEKLNLDLKSNDVRVIGIWGMGGIGKTTLAKAICDTSSHKFEGCSFIRNVKDALKERHLIKVQQQLLSDIKVENKRIRSVRAGVDTIKLSLRSKKILLILDDVNDQSQLKSLVEWDCFGSGSRIIITTRDQHLLKVLKVHDIYECERLDGPDALKLFCLKAFDKEQPEDGYEKLSENIVDYASGLPLALVSLGSLLVGKEIDQWEDTLKRLKKHLDKSIFENLKISYDELSCDTEKKIFIYIACFLKGRNKDLVKDILDGLDVFPDAGMDVLKERSLITISDNIVRVHDLLEQMGWEILHKQPLKERIGLKFRGDIVDALTNNMGTRAIEIINQEVSMKEVANCTCCPKAFSKMRKLRFLKICDVHSSESIEYLSNELRILEWYGYPLTSLPSNFTPNEIYELQMCYSKIGKLWEENMDFLNLGFINLSGSTNLTQTPNLSGTPKLKKLDLSYCKNLVEVHQSTFVHKRLNYLNLTECIRLERFPSKIEMESLETLILSDCLEVKKIPEFGENMKSLQKLHLDGTAIKELPSSMEHLTCLASLDARNCKNLVHIPPNIYGLRSLKSINFSKCSKLKKLSKKLDVSETAIVQSEDSRNEPSVRVRPRSSEVGSLTFRKRLKNHDA